jgi:hypothetical protein
MKMPEMKMPEVKVPDVKLPELKMPDVDVAAMTTQTRGKVTDAAKSAKGSLEHAVTLMREAIGA